MKKIFSIFILIILIAGCKKYPDDAKVPHFRTPEGRLIDGSWVYGHVYNSILNTVPKNIGESRISFEKSKVFIGNKFVPYLNFTGTWKLTNKKKNLVITDDKGNATEYVIHQLDINFLDFRSDSLEFTFKTTLH